ncbi:hypothetical protein EMPG_16521 [Blastomyces silverae]|uniref:Uncharacterized protein n=1 Tax=Blastomyces silverae TaxID=2060906 RepID=A0A0H1B9G2_9EURO|nr:hypothetical protein EMPG_16521 [Blastomyces silverae]
MARWFARDRFRPSHSHPPRPSLGLRPLLPAKWRRHPSPIAPAAHPAHPLAGQNRSHHLRFLDRLRLRP